MGNRNPYADDSVKGLIGGFAITPSDSADLSQIARGIMVGVSGNLKVDMENGDTVTWPSLAAGLVHPLYVRRVYATGTTASSIIGGK